jgi:hypothetical protein
MNKFIKDGQIYNSPITIVGENGKFVSSNPEFLKQYGYEVYVPQPRPLTTMEEINRAITRINQKTEDKILNGFTWNGEKFYLTIENQTNFANLFIARDYLEFPQTIKTKTGYCILNNKEELTDFYLAGVKFIKKCLEEGWQEKTTEEEEIRNR